ncbi:MAG: hypothetical protein JOZ18_18845 [Chloroflexi bacterium]|nr:hypothetical protein [Chloroflexota bacterium]
MKRSREILATFSTARTNISRRCIDRVPFSVPAAIVGVSVVVVSTINFATDANTSVFLCTLLLLTVLLLMGALLSLTLTGLARLTGLKSLVGLLTELATNTV